MSAWIDFIEIKNNMIFLENVESYKVPKENVKTERIRIYGEGPLEDFFESYTFKSDEFAYPYDFYVRFEISGMHTESEVADIIITDCSDGRVLNDYDTRTNLISEFLRVAEELTGPPF